MVKNLIGLVSLGLAIVAPNVAMAQSGDQPNRRAYTYALRCFAAAAEIISDRRVSASDVTVARQRSRRSFEAAHRMGGLLGLSTTRINNDIESTGRSEAALLVRDARYAQRTQAECIRLGL